MWRHNGVRRPAGDNNGRCDGVTLGRFRGNLRGDFLRGSRPMKKADLNQIPARQGSAPYPDPYNEKLKGRTSWTLTSHFGLKQFGVNRVELAPGAWSTQRHWHRSNDEAVIVVSGELTLV